VVPGVRMVSVKRARRAVQDRQEPPLLRRHLYLPVPRQRARVLVPAAGQVLGRGRVHPRAGHAHLPVPPIRPLMQVLRPGRRGHHVANGAGDVPGAVQRHHGERDILVARGRGGSRVGENGEVGIEGGRRQRIRRRPDEARVDVDARGRRAGHGQRQRIRPQQHLGRAGADDVVPDVPDDPLREDERIGGEGDLVRGCLRHHAAAEDARPVQVAEARLELVALLVLARDRKGDRRIGGQPGQRCHGPIPPPVPTSAQVIPAPVGAAERQARVAVHVIVRPLHQPGAIPLVIGHAGIDRLEGRHGRRDDLIEAGVVAPEQPHLQVRSLEPDEQRPPEADRVARHLPGVQRRRPFPGAIQPHGARAVMHEARAGGEDEMHAAGLVHPQARPLYLLRAEALERLVGEFRLPEVRTPQDNQLIHGDKLRDDGEALGPGQLRVRRRGVRAVEFPGLPAVLRPVPVRVGRRVVVPDVDPIPTVHHDAGTGAVVERGVGVGRHDRIRVPIRLPPAQQPVPYLGVRAVSDVEPFGGEGEVYAVGGGGVGGGGGPPPPPMSVVEVTTQTSAQSTVCCVFDRPNSMIPCA
jgi:hypothetical protein